MFTFSCAINQAKNFTLNGACNFQTKSIGNDGVGSIWLDSIEKNDFNVNKLEEDRDQALESRPIGDKY